MGVTPFSTRAALAQRPKSAAVTFIVVRRGELGLGQWLDERRDVADDYRQVSGERPASLPVVVLSIDTTDTRATAEASFVRITLQARRITTLRSTRLPVSRRPRLGPGPGPRAGPDRSPGRAWSG